MARARRLCCAGGRLFVALSDLRSIASQKDPDGCARARGEADGKVGPGPLAGHIMLSSDSIEYNKFQIIGTFWSVLEKMFTRKSSE